MYVSANRVPGRALLRSVPANVLALGTVSLVTDISSEMVTAVLPLYLMLVLGLNPLQLGFLDGLHLAVASLARLAGGRYADRTQHRKAVAAAGYGVSALAKLGLLLASSVPGIATAITADRTGKGLRTAPRDALIAMSTSEDRRGQAFGVHRAMDTFGALLGPLAAFGILAATGGQYSAVFVVSFCIAALGVVLLLLYVRDRPAVVEAAPPRPVNRRLCVVAALLGLTTVSDFFVYLLLQRQLSAEPHLFALLPLGTAAVYLILAIPMGRLADARGRRLVFLCGHGALLAVYLLLAFWASPLVLIPVLALHGAFYAATDGVLMAAAATSSTSALAVLQTVQALARFGSSIAFGAMWTVWQPSSALFVMAAGLIVALLASRKVIA